MATVAPGRPAVLKLPVVASDARDEAAVLRYWDGHGAPRLLEIDLPSGAMLIEYVPGSPLECINCSRSLIDSIGDFLVRLHTERGALPSLPSLDEKLLQLRRGFLRPQFDASALAQHSNASEREEATRAWLRSSTVGRDYPIHGDFHARNVLVARCGLAAIDPYGVVGEAARDVASISMSMSSSVPLVDRLCALSARVGVDHLRAAAHAYAIALGAARFRRFFGAPGERDMTAAAARLEPIVKELDLW
jgi:streptomycin 6-kinase